MKVLCVCEKGNSRSVGCAFLLKKKYHVDALACGVVTASFGTLLMLCNWADLIIVMATRFKAMLPDSVQHKVLIIDVGTDRYFRGWRGDLLEQCDKVLDPYMKSKVGI